MKEYINIGILGLGRTGISIFKFLDKLRSQQSSQHPNINIISWDDRLENTPSDNGFSDNDFIDKEHALSLHLTQPDDKSWTDLDIIFVSPGIPQEHKIFQIAEENNILISSDIELFLLNNRNSNLVFVTGTNGKSTTVSLIEHVLSVDRLGGYVLGGNIGAPVLEIEQGAKGYVLELSSFQIDLLPVESISRQFSKTKLSGYMSKLLSCLDGKDQFTNNRSSKSNESTKSNENTDSDEQKTISVLLNITPDHLDRHKTMQEYIRVKSKLLHHEGVKIIAIDNEITRDIYHDLRPAQTSKVIAVSASGEFADKGEVISLFESASEDNKDVSQRLILSDNFFDAKEYILPRFPNLLGKHNLENIVSTFSVCRLLGMDLTTIFSGVASFKALRHRMQLCGEKTLHQYLKIRFYNDSKATNSDSARKSIAALNNIFWLAGGIFKEDSLNLGEDISNIKKAYLYGRDSKIIADYLKGKVDYDVFDDLEEAFKAALGDAKGYGAEDGNYSSANDNSDRLLNILLAPACASFDQFKNFSERGDRFIQLVDEVINE